MVRFRYKRPLDTKKQGLVYFPFYTETWTIYNPKNTSICIHDNKWESLWQADPDRDRLHRKNSYYYPREKFEDDGDAVLQDSPTLAILLFGTIIFCLFVPQIVDLFISHFCPRPPRPPSPPTPPPGFKSKKRLRIYHYAKVGKRHSTGRKSIFGSTYHYDPENIFNYVSDTRLKALRAYQEELEDEEHAINAASEVVSDVLATMPSVSTISETPIHPPS